MTVATMEEAIESLDSSHSVECVKSSKINARNLKRRVCHSVSSIINFYTGGEPKEPSLYDVEMSRRMKNVGRRQSV
jgi:hypothetical protein